ncbi:MAG TPA: DUF3365 domain-containing protein [Thioploca sp.]|nr:DUF3365 domain-containing protein [Thioploca sp.]
MKKMLVILLFIPLVVNAIDEIGIAAQGGYPEYLFLEKVTESEAETTAALIAKAIAKGRLVIFAQMGKLTNPNIGNKNFTGDIFLKQWQASIEADLIDISSTQQRIIDKLLWAGKQCVDNNQDRINIKGVKWKHFLPAKWARETGLMFNSRTGIVTKQPSIHYRHPSNVPDEKERKILTEFMQTDAKPKGEFAMMGKQKIYRYFDPIFLMPACLACHGKPKGELDILGFQKDGLETGDIIGLISVSVAVE